MLYRYIKIKKKHSAAPPAQHAFTLSRTRSQHEKSLQSAANPRGQESYRILRSCILRLRGMCRGSCRLEQQNKHMPRTPGPLRHQLQIQGGHRRFHFTGLHNHQLACNYCAEKYRWIKMEWKPTEMPLRLKGAK